MRPTIEQIRTILPAASMVKWNLVGINMSAESPLASPNADAMNMRCVSTTLPKLTESPMEINIRGHKVRQPGIYDYEKQFTLIFIESVDNTISNFLRDWRELCWQTETGVQLPKNQLEASIVIQRLNPQDEPVFQYELIGCYLADFDLGTLDNISTEAMQPSIIFNYDYFKDKAL